MQWRMLARRCPVKSMTVVGDIAQTSADLATTTWTERLAELRTSPRLEELSICYRSPRELVEAVEPLLRKLRPDARRLDAVRTTGNRPVIADGSAVESAATGVDRDEGSAADGGPDQSASSAGDAGSDQSANSGADAGPGGSAGKNRGPTFDEDEQVAAWARTERGGDRCALLTPDVPGMLGVLEAAGIDASADDLRARLVVLAPEAAKGLEFDHVLVHAPDRIVEESGLATLYVALTRATATLAVVQSEPIETDLGDAWARRSLRAARP